nr:universal stress protein [Brucella anthropi]
MSYKPILVNIDINGPVVPILQAATGLARCHEAKLIGICSADAPMPMVGPEAAALAAETWQQMRNDIEKRFKEVHREYDRVIAGAIKPNGESLKNPTHALVQASRSADLIVTAASDGASTGDAYRVADPANVVLRAGRPLLVVADRAEHVQAKKIVVAWKDTREARRAVADSIPLLVTAKEVIVVTVVPESDDCVRDGPTDVVAFLALHGIEAKPKLIEGPDEYIELFNFIDGSDADLVVSRAYGHSPFREWAIGGITRSLLDETRLDRFMPS